jgi:hypothetical protein
MTAEAPGVGAKRPDPALRTMLVTGDFLLLDVPHTGGAVLRRMWLEHAPRDRLVRNSLVPQTPYARVAHDFADLPMVCFVRNPWDWYVAWHDSVAARATGQQWETLFARGAHDFRTVVSSACDGAEDGRDRYSTLFESIAGEGVAAGKVEVVPYERLGKGFLEFAARHRVAVPGALARALAGLPGGDPHSYRERYDDELRALVQERTAALIADYGYSF